MSNVIAYTLEFEAAAQHYVDVTLLLPPLAPTHFAQQALTDDIVLSLPVWTPGSYMVREYARCIDAVHAFDGQQKALRVRKTRKNHWCITPVGPGPIEVRYRVYGREMTVRTNWIEAAFALINGAPTFLTVPSLLHTPHKVTVVLPEAWPKVISALPRAADGTYTAPTYDALVDTPWLLGDPHTDVIEVSGKKHVLSSIGGGHVFDYAQALADTGRIVAEHHALWGEVPYENYTFFNLLTEGRGGLEHKDSSVLMASPHATRSRADYVDWLGLVSHEFFHVWNIKRLRPVALGPFDYDNEVPTPSLWIAEGLTAYYDNLQVHRAGLASRSEYLARLSRGIEMVQQAPGRLVQTLAQASYDAWIKFYRRDENSDNTGVSYYLKGSIVGFLLDAKLREHTGDKANLDTLMRLAYSRFSGETGYTEAEFRLCASEIAQVDLTAFFASAVDTCEELDFTQALSWYGLRFEAHPKAASTDAASAAWLGLTTRAEGARVFVSQVLRGTPAYEAGLNVDDELLFFDSFRVTAAKWAERLRQVPVGHSIALEVCRRDRAVTLYVTPRAQPVARWHLCPDPKATPTQKAHLEAWLGSLTAPQPHLPARSCD